MIAAMAIAGKHILVTRNQKHFRALLPQNQLRGFWLTDGEECACIAIAYDWMYDSLSMAERKTLVDIARNRLLALGLEECRMGGQWWFAKRFSNWNAVCAGGLGMLCLAMYEDCPAAREILPHIEESLSEFIVPLKKTDGGWPEGVGYWNYGMAYAFGYLMSWERSMGKVHPLMKLPATKKTLSFPLDFSPNAMSAGFGDNFRLDFDTGISPRHIRLGRDALPYRLRFLLAQQIVDVLPQLLVEFAILAHVHELATKFSSVSIEKITVVTKLPRASQQRRDHVSASTSRSLLNALRMRVFTVPVGIPMASAISS